MNSILLVTLGAGHSYASYRGVYGMSRCKECALRDIVVVSRLCPFVPDGINIVSDFNKTLINKAFPSA